MAQRPKSTSVLDRRSYEAGKVIFSQGQTGDAAFVVESGEVGIYKTIDGEQVKLGTVTSGGIFGEMAVIDNSPRMAAAVAEAGTTLVRVPKGVFDQKMAACDPFIRGLISIFLTNIRSAHTLYTRRPRSLPDSLKLLENQAATLRTYVESIRPGEFGPEMTAALATLDAAIARVAAVAASHHDRRSSVLTDEALKGVGLGTVLERT